MRDLTVSILSFAPENLENNRLHIENRLFLGDVMIFTILLCVCESGACAAFIIILYTR